MHLLVSEASQESTTYTNTQFMGLLQTLVKCYTSAYKVAVYDTNTASDTYRTSLGPMAGAPTGPTTGICHST
jgi:hypothetical protein